MAKIEQMPVGLNNLYVSGLDKNMSELDVRRTFGRFGKISSFKLVSKSEYLSNIAFIAYLNPEHAKQALLNVSIGTVVWHKAKEQDNSEILKSID